MLALLPCVGPLKPLKICTLWFRICFDKNVPIWIDAINQFVVDCEVDGRSPSSCQIQEKWRTIQNIEIVVIIWNSKLCVPEPKFYNRQQLPKQQWPLHLILEMLLCVPCWANSSIPTASATSNEPRSQLSSRYRRRNKRVVQWTGIVMEVWKIMIHRWILVRRSIFEIPLHANRVANGLRIRQIVKVPQNTIW